MCVCGKWAYGGLSVIAVWLCVVGSLAKERDLHFCLFVVSYREEEQIALHYCLFCDKILQ